MKKIDAEVLQIIVDMLQAQIEAMQKVFDQLQEQIDANKHANVKEE